VENLLWKRLQTFHKVDYKMNEYEKQPVKVKDTAIMNYYFSCTMHIQET